MSSTNKIIQSTKSAAIAKFRPVLSTDEITHILKLAKRDGTKESMRLIASLARIEWQINSGAMTPAYISEPRASLIEDCGFDEPSDTHAHINTDDANDESLYNLWLNRPQSLTAMQVSRVRAWRYQNGKMTVDEEKLFEKEVLGLNL